MSNSPITPTSGDYKSLRTENESSSYDENVPRLKTSLSTIGTGSAYEYSSLHRAYPFAAQSPVPQMHSRGSRMHSIGRKLAFWRKRPTNTSDVHSALHKLASSHDQYRQDLQNATNVLKEWTEYLSPPSLISEDLLQHQLIDINLSQWLGSLLDAIKPVAENERKFNEVYTALAHSFETLKKEEASCKIAINKQSHAERRFFKAMASNCTEQETDHLNNVRSRLVNEVEIAADRFHMACRRELPLRFSQMRTYYEQISRETKRAGKSIERLLSAEDGLESPSVRGDRPLYDDRSSAVPSLSSTPSPFNAMSSVGPLHTPKYPGMSYLPSSGPRSSNPSALPTPIESPEENEMSGARSLGSAEQPTASHLELDLSSVGVGPESLVWT